MFYLMAGYILFINVSLLTVLVPGGPIENRDFSHLKGLIFWGFNLFLISLGLLSFITSYFLMLKYSWALWVAIILGLAYLFVYALDLAKIFPKSPTDMSKVLMLMEIINSLAAVLLIIICSVGIMG